jgi:RHS repeat-associated protein
LGSVREMTDSSTNIVWQQSFDPWGIPTRVVSTTPADFGYAGMYQHSRSGLNVTLLRAYYPQLSRWLSRDPVGESAGLNLHAYVANNPILLIDPYGAQKCDPCEVKTGWALFECRRTNDPCKNLWGWALDICRKFNPGSNPDDSRPYDPKEATLDQLENDFAPQDIIDAEIIRRGTELGDRGQIK